MRRLTLLLVTVWAVMAAPAMCTAGVLAHVCACTEGTVCDHETGCDTDPCSEQLYRKDGAGPELAGAVDAVPVAVLPASPAFAIVPADRRVPSGAALARLPRTLPRAGRLPLLI